MTVYHVILVTFAVVSVTSLVALAVILWRYEGSYESGNWRH